jgi:hypothetical protein
MTCIECSEKISYSLALVESAIEKYEVEDILCEAANDGSEEKANKRKMGETISNTIKRLTEMIIALVRAVSIKLKNLVNKGKSLVLPKDMEVHLATIKGVPSFMSKVIDYITKLKDDAKFDRNQSIDLVEELRKVDESKYTIKKGTKINPTWMQKNLDACNKYAVKAQALNISPMDMPVPAWKPMRTMLSFLNTIVSEINTVLAELKSETVRDKKPEETKLLEGKKEVNNESIDFNMDELDIKLEW